jgi:WD40 repeat protein
VSNLDLGLTNISGLGVPFITMESNKTCKLWTTERSDPLLELENSSHSRFFFKDALIVQSKGSRLNFYNYQLEKPDPSLIQPALHSLYNKVKRISSLDALDDANSSISAIGCANSTRSGVILVSGKNKSLCILDVNQGKIIKRIPDAMKRPIHKIAVPDLYTLYNFQNTNLFATASICDSVKIWDMRTQVIAMSNLTFRLLLCIYLATSIELQALMSHSRLVVDLSQPVCYPHRSCIIE